MPERSGELGIVPEDQQLQLETQCRAWIGHIWTAASNEDIWDYIDPDLSEQGVLQVLKATQEPKPSSIQSNAETSLSPFALQFEYHRLLRRFVCFIWLVTESRYFRDRLVVNFPDRQAEHPNKCFLYLFTLVVSFRS
jgi:hypothetical protein